MKMVLSGKPLRSAAGILATLFVLASTGCNLFPPQPGGTPGTSPPATQAAASPAPAQTSPDAAGRSIAFLMTDAFGNPNDLYGISPDGSGLRPLPLDNASPEKFISSCWPPPAFSPDGRYLAAARSTFREDADQRQEGDMIIKVPLDPRELVVIDMATGKVVAVVSSFGSSFDWSPDSKTVLHTRPIEWDMNSGNAITDQGLWVLELASGEDRQALPPQTDFTISGVDWSPDGTRIAFHGAVFEGMGPFGTIHIDGSGFKVWEDSIGSFDWSPDGQHIAHDEVTYVSFPPAKLFVTNADGSNSIIIVNDEKKTAVQPKWSPDGKLIAFVDGLEDNATVWLVEPNGANLRQVNVSGLRRVSWLSWSPDGTRLLVSGENKIFVVPLDGGAPFPLGDGACAVW